MLGKADAAARIDHGEQHRQAVAVPADHGAARRAEAGRHHQRLDLDQDRPRAFDAGEHGRARCRGQPVAEEQLGRVGDLAQAVGGHLEHADLVGGAEAVLGGAQDAIGVAAVALEVEHRVDHVLDHLGTGDLAVLGDVADQQQRAALRLGVAHQRLRGGAHLADGAGCGLERVGPQRLDGIDDDQVGARPVGERGQDVGDVGLAGERQRRLGEPETFGAQAHLGGRLLAGEVDGAPSGVGEGGGQLQQQRRLADAGLAADQQRRARHDAAAGDAIELGQARSARRAILSSPACVRVSRATTRPLEDLLRPEPGMGVRVGFLDDGVPLAAGGAFARPARRHAPQFWQTKVLRAVLAKGLSSPLARRRDRRAGRDGRAARSRWCRRGRSGRRP